MWFGEFKGNKIAMFDPETEKFQEWTPPTPWTLPYDVVADKNGEVWAGSMYTDRITRLDPKTGKMFDYLLPRNTNIRRVFVDNSTTPVTFWVGSDHGASVIKTGTSRLARTSREEIARGCAPIKKGVPAPIGRPFCIAMFLY